VFVIAHLEQFDLLDGMSKKKSPGEIEVFQDGYERRSPDAIDFAFAFMGETDCVQCAILNPAAHRRLVDAQALRYFLHSQQLIISWFSHKKASNFQ
jgi:hypothetical protein